MKIVKFIVGIHGSNRYEKIKQIILDEINSQNKKIILIVPEQSSFKTEKYILDFFGNIDANKIKVLSFSRIFNFVANCLKIPIPKIANEIDQIVTINEAMEVAKPKLRIYKKNSADIHLSEMILNTFHEFKSNRIDPEILRKIYDNTNQNLLKQKLEEIIYILEAYQETTKNIIDPFENLNILEDIIISSNFFEGYSIFFNEFSNFTAQQFSIIEVMMKQAKNIFMSFCTENLAYKDSNYNLFLPVDKTIQKIKTIAQNNSIKTETYLVESDVSTRNSELDLLEKNIFNPDRQAYSDAPKNIYLYNALNLNEECEYVARTIKKLVIEQNYQYKDFAVITRDIQSYSAILESSLKRYNVSYFIDAPEKLFNKNLTNLIFLAFDVIHSNYSVSDICSYLKTGLIGLSIEESSILENYILLWNINSDMWLSDFTLHPEGFHKNFEEKDIETLKKINELRQTVIIPLENFRKKINKANCKEISEAVYKLLIEVKADEHLREFCNELEKNNNIELAEKHTVLWDKIIEVIDQIATIIGNKKISSKKYVDLLRCAINFVDCSYVPQRIDNVIISSINRTNPSPSKVVFIIGAVDGEFPKVPDSSEIFTDNEINHISSLGIEIKDNSEAFIAKERFLAYTAIASASERLFISWPSSDSFKKNKLPSEIVKEIRLTFPSIKILYRDNFSDEDMIFSASSAFEIYSKTKNNQGILHSTLKKYISLNPNYKQKSEMLEKILDKNHLQFSDSNNATSLFGKNISISASQIEKYYTCKFSYFCEYGLKAKPKNTSDFNSLDYGTLVHFVLEKIFKKCSQKNMAENINEEILYSELDSIIDSYVDEKLGGWENKPKTFLYAIKRLKKSLSFLFKHISEEFEQSEFKVLDTELEISNKGIIKPVSFYLDSGQKISIEGKIDRADIMNIENKNYVRIVDYKTSSKQFKLSDVLYGLNMQMLIYLLTIHKNGIKGYKNLIPAGILYFTALKPLIDTQNFKDTDKIKSELRKKLRMNGLILENESVITGMEKEAKGEFIPVTIKNGEIKTSDSLINLESLEVVYDHIEKLIKDMVKNLQLGKISTSPISSKNVTACKWCRYFSICCYEGDKFKKIPSSISNEEIIEKMKGDTFANGK